MKGRVEEGWVEVEGIGDGCEGIGDGVLVYVCAKVVVAGKVLEEREETRRSNSPIARER